MVDPVGAVGLNASLIQTASQSAPNATGTVAATPQQAQNFASAVHSVTEMPVATPTTHVALGERLMSQLDDLSHHLQSPPTGRLDTQGDPTGAQEHPKIEDFAQQMEVSITQMDQAYMYAIEATMASHGSTETTKIFNTLLKGQ